MQSVNRFERLGTQEQNTTSSVCGICIEGKQKRANLTGAIEKYAEILHTIHSDICGPMATEGLMGERYFVTFIDERCGRLAI